MTTAKDRDAAIAALNARVTALEQTDLSLYATTAQLTAEAGIRAAADTATRTDTAAAVFALDARIDALEDSEPPDPEPPVPPTGKVVRFGPGTVAAFLALCKDLSVDVIEMAGGTHPGWACFLDVARPPDRPLLIRPMAGAAVVWDGTGTINTPPFRIGWSSKASYITIEPAGTGGSFTAQNYKLGKAGLVMGRNFDHITFNGLIVRNVEGGFGDGIPGQQQHTHAVYLMGNAGRSKAWTSNGWDVVGPANRMLNGLQTDGSPNADGVTAKGWKVRSLHRAVFAWSDPTGIVIDGWDIADCNVTIDNNKGQQSSAGVVKNCKAVRSGPLANGQGMWGGTRLVDGGGNTSA